MRKLFLLILLTPVFIYGQTDFIKKYNQADSLLQSNNFEDAYLKFKYIESNISKSDTLYNYVLWHQTQIVTYLEHLNRMNQNFESSLEYGLEGLEGLELITKGKECFDTEHANREPFMLENIVVSYSGLGKFDQAEKYKSLLYKAYDEKKCRRESMNISTLIISNGKIKIFGDMSGLLNYPKIGFLPVFQK